jgi:hypothetical protein
MTTSSHNIVTPLSFSGRFVEARLVQQAKHLPIEGHVIVVNLDTAPAYVAETPRKGIPALSSTILVDTYLEQAASVVLLKIVQSGDVEATSVADIVTEPGWALFADILAHDLPPSFPRDTPLWRSSVDDVGTTGFDPAAVLAESVGAARSRRFRVTANLWFAPANTDCVIHNQHDFMEIHSQVYGLGRMQKFRADDHSTLYEDLLMSPGYTTPMPFCTVGADGSFVYPWHQYHADTDCVWLAVEYHATG